MPILALTSFTRLKAADLISRISTGARNAQGVELEPNGDSNSGDISGDGRHVVFISTAANLGGDPSRGIPVLLYKDLGTGAVRIVSTLPPTRAAMRGSSAISGIPGSAPMDAMSYSRRT
jgi:hypothetical protein